MKQLKNLSGAWSAATTPLTESLAIDAVSVRRMVRHQIKHNGMFIGGTCSEGPWLPRKDMRRLQAHCDKINYAAYGGRKIKSWLTGLKYALVKMDIFSTTAGYLRYPLSKAAVANIERMIIKQKNSIAI